MLQKARFVVVLPGGIVEEFLCLGFVVSSLFGVFVVVPPFALVLGHVVVFLLVGMPQSSPCARATVLVLVRFFKINWMTGFLPRSFKTMLLMINQYYSGGDPLPW